MQIEKAVVACPARPGGLLDDGCADERKELLMDAYDATASVDYGADQLSISDFFLREHVHFSHYSVHRALPSAVDGLTPSRRKALFYFLGRKEGEIKVAQAAAGVAEKTMYLHGEASLVETIVGMAQSYVGTNNVALLVPSGQFGSRNDKPSVHAAARYIFTAAHPVTRALFPAADEPVLEYLDEEGQSIEPKHYAPVLPMLLVNGAVGIGTGFATSVPSYSVRDLCAGVRALLAGAPPPPLRPYFEGFEGEVEASDRAVVTRGRFVREDARTLLITELPVGRWTDPYLTELKQMVDGSKKSKGLGLASVTNLGTESAVRIRVTLAEENVDDEALAKALKLSTSLPTTYMNAFDRHGRLRLFPTAQTVLEEHATARLELYEARRAHQLRDLRCRGAVAEARAAFVRLVVSGELRLAGAPRQALLAELEARGLVALSPKVGAPESHEHLLGLNVASFTSERIEALRAEAARLVEDATQLEASSPAALWEADLRAVEAAYDQYRLDVAARRADADPDVAKKRPAGKKRKIQ